MLESVAEGTGSHGIVVQGVETHAWCRWMKTTGKWRRGGLQPRNDHRASRSRKGEFGFQESGSLRLLS